MARVQTYRGITIVWSNAKGKWYFSPGNRGGRFMEKLEDVKAYIDWYFDESD